MDTALDMLGGGGELIVQVVASVAGAEARRCGTSSRRRAGKALEALTRFGTALRDEIEPSADPLSFAIGEEQFGRRLHHEHALEAGAPELVPLRPPPPGRDRERAGVPRGGARVDREWRELVESLRNDAPEVDVLRRSYQQELVRARQFVTDEDLVSVPGRPVEVVPTPSFLVSLVPFAAYEPPPIFLRDQRGRFYVTRPDPSLPPDRLRAAAPGPLPPRHPGDGGARGVSRPSPPAGHRPRSCSRRCGAISGRR